MGPSPPHSQICHSRGSRFNDEISYFLFLDLLLKNCGYVLLLHGSYEADIIWKNLCSREKMKVKHLFYAIAICTAGVVLVNNLQQPSASVISSPDSAHNEILPSETPVVSDATDQAGLAYQNHQSGTQMTVSGRVIKILSDDNSGSRHQRFIIELGSGQTLLIAHNIDLAGYVDGLSEGSQVSVSGEYEWNEKGGVVHWTHHDPQGSHPGGWIQFNGKRYE